MRWHSVLSRLVGSSLVLSATRSVPDGRLSLGHWDMLLMQVSDRNRNILFGSYTDEVQRLYIRTQHLATSKSFYGNWNHSWNDDLTKSNRWFPILGGLTCGTSGVFLWTASGAINLVCMIPSFRLAFWYAFDTFLDPPVQERGRAVATKFTLQNFASSLGGMISLGLNIRQSQAGRVSDCKINLLTILKKSTFINHHKATYFVFISIMALGLPAAMTIPQPHQVVRGDGSRVSAHRFQSWKRELAGLRRTLGLKSFHILLPFLIYWVSLYAFFPHWFNRAHGQQQWDLSYMWTWNAQYHSVRARALLSTLFYLSKCLLWLGS